MEGEVGEVIVLRVPGKRDLVNWKKINQVLELNGYLSVGFFFTKKTLKMLNVNS